jgi:preprotein translocase subunit SecG
MEILRYVLIVVEVLCCLLLIGVILLQQSKSQGMGLAFGGGMGETLFGSRAGNVLTKITVTLALIFLANTTLLGIMYTTGSEKSLVESAPAPAPLPMPGGSPAGDGGLLSAPPQQAAQPLMTSDEGMMVAPETSFESPVQDFTIETPPPGEIEEVAAPVIESVEDVVEETAQP